MSTALPSQPRSTIIAAFAVLLTAAPAGTLLAVDDAAIDFFEKQVRPILVARCHECHSGQLAKPKGGLRLDSRAAAMKGGDTGPAIVSGQPQQSLLIDAVNHGELYQMPPKSKLPASEIVILTKWVEMDAPWPTEAEARSTGGVTAEFNLAQRKADHWCWQPVRAIAPPSVQNEAWVKQSLDRFILSKLEENGLSPTPPADQRTLLRRAYFDLLGLPPSAEEVEEFVRSLSLSPGLPFSPSGNQDKQTGRQGEEEKDAYEAMIDRLLASPHFGERWARHWLDLVRYAESRGHEFDYDIPNAFEYRDYVIRAFNADVPYDQFVVEHVAGDLLNTPRLHPTEQFNESIIGTGFWFLGEWSHSPVDIRKDECDRIDNMLDAFSKTFLGITVACARCHDHKFDAISQRDYYALAGYLQCSSYRLARFETWQQDRKIAAELSSLDEMWRPKIAAAVVNRLRPRLDELSRTLAADSAKLTAELGVTESDLRGAERILDYADLPAGDWSTDGPTFGVGPVKPGQILLTGDVAAPLEIAKSGAARRNPAWGDLGLAVTSENDSGRLNGWLRAGRTLKTPTFTLKNGNVHYLIEGVGHVYAVVDSHAMINGPLHAELLKETGGNGNLPTRWITHDLSRYVGERVHLEFSPKEDQDFRVLMIAEGHDRPAPPTMRANRLLQSALAASSQDSSVIGCRELIATTLELLARDRLTADSHSRDRAALANWLVAQANSGEQQPSDLATLAAAHSAARDKLIATIRNNSRLCLAMWDGTPVNESLLIRGNHKTVGPIVPRQFLDAFQESGAGRRESGINNRLDLARQLVDPQNPLFSRVIVNRVWQHLMGRGIVPSVDNFGVLGQSPTHPELLDYLADEFIRDGWSLKRLISRIMLSSTYRQGSGVRGQESEEQVDPQNLLFHHQNLKRLEGEALRDFILAISGRLDRTQYGPSIPIYLTPFMQGRGRPKESGPLDGSGRRSINIAVRRNFLSPMMLAFDTPIPFTTIGRRNVSNVPAQALILMNDPFVAEQSRLWAHKLLADKTASPSDRIRQMYLAAFSREPTIAETSAAQVFLKQQVHEYSLSQEKTSADERAWADLGHVIMNAKEFVFVN